MPPWLPRESPNASGGSSYSLNHRGKRSREPAQSAAPRIRFRSEDARANAAYSGGFDQIGGEHGNRRRFSEKAWCKAFGKGLDSPMPSTPGPSTQSFHPRRRQGRCSPQVPCRLLPRADPLRTRNGFRGSSACQAQRKPRGRARSCLPLTAIKMAHCSFRCAAIIRRRFVNVARAGTAAGTGTSTAFGECRIAFLKCYGLSRSKGRYSFVRARGTVTPWPRLGSRPRLRRPPA